MLPINWHSVILTIISGISKAFDKIVSRLLVLQWGILIETASAHRAIFSQNGTIWQLSFQLNFFLIRILGIDLNVSRLFSKFWRDNIVSLVMFILMFTVTADSFQHYMSGMSRDPKAKIFWVESLGEKTSTNLKHFILHYIGLQESFRQETTSGKSGKWNIAWISKPICSGACIKL